MNGYTKLFNSILASTIWREDDKTRIVWITLLAMADRHGVADGSVPGLADFARVSIADCRHALERLSSPDEDSRSQEHDGRRIEPVEGGWRLLNHGKYRQKLSVDERREYLKVKQREYRAKKRQHTSTTVNNVSDTDTLLTQAEAEAEAEASPKEHKSTLARARFERFWSGYPRKVGKDAAWKTWGRLKPTDSLTEHIIAAVSMQAKSPQWTKDGGQFIPHPRTWLHQGRWQDEPPSNGNHRQRTTTPARQPCPHVEPCNGRQMCALASEMGRPEKPR